MGYRNSYVPEQAKPERRYGKDDYDFSYAGFENPTPQPDALPEFKSLEAFIEDKFDEEITTFTGGDLQRLAQSIGLNHHVVRKHLESFGLKLTANAKERDFRTFGDNPHNRWTSAEARMMSGGSGGSQIMGYSR